MNKERWLGVSTLGQSNEFMTLAWAFFEAEELADISICYYH
jgi:hypothetical protein